MKNAVPCFLQGDRIFVMLRFFSISNFPFDAGAGFLFLSSLPFFKIIAFSFDALTLAGHFAGHSGFLLF